LKRAVEEETRARPPELRESPLLASTTYVIQPQSLPREHMDPEVLIAVLRHLFRVKFKESDVPSASDAASKITYLIEHNRTVNFENGMFEYGEVDDNRRRTPVARIHLTHEAVGAAVVGSTLEATWVAKRVAEAVWEATGVSQRWADFQAAVQYVGYQTQSSVDLGGPLERVLSRSFRDFLRAELESPQSKGTRMGRTPVDAGERAAVSPDVLILGLERVELKLVQFTTLTGREETCKVRLFVTSKDHYRRGIVVVESELPSAEHTAFVVSLRDSLTGS
jgi:hypothetical protein